MWLVPLLLVFTNSRTLNSITALIAIPLSRIMFVTSVRDRLTDCHRRTAEITFTDSAARSLIPPASSFLPSSPMSSAVSLTYCGRPATLTSKTIPLCIFMKQNVWRVRNWNAFATWRCVIFYNVLPTELDSNWENNLHNRLHTWRINSFNLSTVFDCSA